MMLLFGRVLQLHYMVVMLLFGRGVTVAIHGSDVAVQQGCYSCNTW